MARTEQQITHVLVETIAEASFSNSDVIYLWYAALSIADTVVAA